MNKNTEILDLRFAICDWKAGSGDAGGIHGGRGLVGFLEERAEPLLRKMSSFHDQLQLANERDHPQRKSFRAKLKIRFGHQGPLRVNERHQPLSPNRKSQI